MTGKILNKNYYINCYISNVGKFSMKSDAPKTILLFAVVSILHILMDKEKKPFNEILKEVIDIHFSRFEDNAAAGEKNIA